MKRGRITSSVTYARIIRSGIIWTAVIPTASRFFVSTKQLPQTRIVNMAYRCPTSFLESRMKTTPMYYMLIQNQKKRPAVPGTFQLVRGQLESDEDVVGTSPLITCWIIFLAVLTLEESLIITHALSPRA